MPGGINVGRINEIAACRDKTVHHLEAFLLRGFVLSPECHRSQTKFTDLLNLSFQGIGSSYVGIYISEGSSVQSR